MRKYTAEAQKPKETEILANDATESVGLLFRLRVPWLLFGLLGGAAASIIVSRFETVISRNIGLAFFLPLIVYMSDAVGTQTEAIYIRNLAKRQIKFWVYLVKELSLGILLGALFGLLIGVFSYAWLKSASLAWTIALAMGVNVAIAPVVALLVPLLIKKEHHDPAVGAGPFTTTMQDIISILIYFLVASVILF